MKILVGLLALLSFMLISSMTSISYGQIDNFCWPIPFQKEIKLSEAVFVGNPVSSTTDSSNRTVIFDTIQTIKGDVPDSLKINLSSREIVDSDEEQISMMDFFKFHDLPFVQNRFLIFLDSNELGIGCNTNSGELDFNSYSSKQGWFLTPNAIHRANMLDYYFSENLPSPLKQINESWNRYGDYICADGMVHVRSFSYTMACVTEPTAEKLVQRGGWVDLDY